LSASGLYNVYLYAIVVEKGDQYIIATGNTLRGESAQQSVKEIVQTISLDTK
jgi:ribosomal protein L21